MKPANSMGRGSIAGWIDHLGYLRCAACATEHGIPETRLPAIAIHPDSNPHAFEECELCHRIVNEVALCEVSS